MSRRVNFASEQIAKDCEGRFQNGDGRHQILRDDGRFRRSAPSMRQALLLANDEDQIVTRRKPPGYSVYGWVITKAAGSAA